MRAKIRAARLFMLCNDTLVLRSKRSLVVINRTSHLCDPVQLWPRVIRGLSFSRSQPDSEGFSPGTPVFLPPQIDSQSVTSGWVSGAP